MQIVFEGDNFHEVSNPIYWGEKKITMSSADYSNQHAKC